MSQPVAMLKSVMRRTANSATDAQGSATDINFTFMTRAGKFLNFGSMMMLLGTMGPQLFHSARNQMMTKAQAQLAGK
ncbi:hypothetical protein [Pseudooceanicola marinus]|nr:hypothetical protein [Pseudooceanicola marinus]